MPVSKQNPCTEIRTLRQINKAQSDVGCACTCTCTDTQDVACTSKVGVLEQILSTCIFDLHMSVWLRSRTVSAISLQISSATNSCCTI